MKHKIIFIILLSFWLTTSTEVRSESDRSNQFETETAKQVSTDSILSLDDILQLVALNNLSFQSNKFRVQAALSSLKQASLKPNPELSVEFEELHLGTPGVKESEITVSLAQEFDFFGQRNAKKNLASTEIQRVKFENMLLNFELYLKTKQQYYNLVHAQQKAVLTMTSYELSTEIVENIRSKINKGSALQSELLLAQLEQQRAQLASEQAKQNALAVEALLVTLWNGNQTGLLLIHNNEPDFSKLSKQVSVLSQEIELSRDISLMMQHSQMLLAEKSLVEAEAKPPIILSAGIKRIEFDNSNSFLFGVSLPIPFRNSKQGEREKLDANIRSMHYDIEQTKNETRANIQSQSISLQQLINTHAALDSLLLPTAKKVYKTLKSTYEAGRLPYTQLLEAERTLNELSFEHNDMLLEIQKQIIALEQLTLVALRTDKEKL